MARRKPAKLPVMGDTGPKTAAQATGAIYVVEDGYKKKRRENVLERMCLKDKSLTQRQYQAGEAIQEAREACEALTSGSEIKEQVDSTPKPDAFIAAQVEAYTKLEKAMEKVRPEERVPVELVCWYNMPLSTSFKGRHHAQNKKLMMAALDRVADYLGY